MEYWLDCYDLITRVSDDFDESAVNNGAPRLARGGALGTPIFRHVSGEAVRLLYRMMFRRVRAEGVTLTREMRCDTPAARRWTQLTVRADAQEFEGLVVSCSTVNEQSVASPELRYEPQSPVAVCSVCARFCLSDGHWFEARLPGEQWRHMGGPTGVVGVRYDLCADCRDPLCGSLYDSRPSGVFPRSQRAAAPSVENDVVQTTTASSEAPPPTVRGGRGRAGR